MNLSNIRSILNEMENPTSDNKAIAIRSATIADRKKGEVYVVYDTDSKTIVTYNSKRMHNLKRDTAKAVAETNSKWKVVSATWAHDNDIS